MRTTSTLLIVLLLIAGQVAAQDEPSGDFATIAPTPNDDTPADRAPPPPSESISSNPGAVNLITGTGALGRWLGLEDDWGLRLGGLWIGDTNVILSGGRDPGAWGLNSLAIVDVNLDTEKAFGWSGGQFDAAFLQLNGQETNSLAGAFPSFNSLLGVPPFVRSELYQLWYRQTLFDDKLIFRIGKVVPTYDFNNVVRPVPVGDAAAAIPAVTGLIYTPIFVNPTMQGFIPGYYNSAFGITTTFVPTESIYLNYGFYDGNHARGVETGLTGPHFNGYYFHIGEVGFSYRAGAERKPGNFGIGVWGQTGKLQDFAGGTVDGAQGVYLFGSQRLWFRRPNVDNSGVSGFYQWGANDSNALLARHYFGAGLTAFGLVPGRPDDSFGCGLAWTFLNQQKNSGLFFAPGPTAGPMTLRDNQLMLQCYYQMKLIDGAFLQTALTDIPNPGESPTLPNALALTMRLIVLF